jgi:ADP-heptose:LPS heptosyltransferase
LVITVDNSTAHLAGALGKKTWVLLTHTPDWRWMLDREDSPWYAALQLYRQGADRRWGPVLERVNQDLQKNLCSFSLPSVQSPATS